MKEKKKEGTIRKRFKEEKASITVEASISMVFFTFVMIMILWFINIARAQAIVQNAVDKATMEISEYMYLYQVTGLYQLDMSMQQEGEAGKQQSAEILGKADETIAGVESIFSMISGSANTIKSEGIEIEKLQETYNSIHSGAKSTKQKFDELKATFSGIKDDPVTYMKSMAALGISFGMDTAKSYLIGSIMASGFSRKYIAAGIDGKSNESAADKKLKSLGVVDGMEGLDFSHSSIFDKKAPGDINIVVVYKMKVIPLLGDWEVTFAQSASTRGWIGGDGVMK